MTRLDTIQFTVKFFEAVASFDRVLTLSNGTRIRFEKRTVIDLGYIHVFVNDKELDYVPLWPTADLSYDIDALISKINNL